MTEETTVVKGKGLAIAGMIVGIVAAILSIFTIGVLFGIVALVLSAIGLYQLMNSNGPKGMAIAGIALGVFAIAFSYYQLSRATAFIEEGGNDFLKEFKQEMEKLKDESQSQLDEIQNDANVQLEDAVNEANNEIENAQ